MSFRVKDVYAGQSVLITGGTGFLGKVLIEKILYSIPDVGKIFLIIRPSKGAAPKARLEKILQDPLFDRLKKENPSAFDKLIPIEGDLLEEHLGISPHDLQILSNEVSIVIHSAATVKFDEELRDAVAMNVSGTTRLIALCHKMNNLISLVHVSTAYANCNLSETEEKVYEPPIPPQKFVEALNWMDDEMVKLITPRLLGNRPNTYTLTKALAEKQLHEDAGTLPVIVIRPSIVGAMWGSPLPGWTDNMNGPTGIFSAVGKGVLTNMCGSDESNADIIPVDIVANMIIVAAAHRAHVSYEKIPIMHCASGDLNPLKWGKIVIFLEQFYDKYPMDQCFAVPSTHFHTSRLFFRINHNIRHELPAKMLDFAYGLAGQKPMFVRLYSRVWKMIETLHFFTTRGWTFHSKQLPVLWDTLHDEDKKEFNFDIRQVNWEEYLCDYAFGVKKYIMKDNMNNLRPARRNLTMLKLMKLALQGIFWYVMVRIFGNRQTKKNQWIAWTVGLLLSQLYSRSVWRPKAYVKSLEEFKKTHYV